MSEDNVSSRDYISMRLECLKTAASIHTSSIDMTLAGAEKMFQWLIENSNDNQQNK